MRCVNRAFDGTRLWLCCLPCGHDGECFGPRWDWERPFWQDWTEEVIFDFGDEKPSIEKDPAPRRVLPVRIPSPYEPAFTFLPKDGVKREKKYRKAEYAGPNDGVATAVRWGGHRVANHPTLSQLEGDQGDW